MRYKKFIIPLLVSSNVVTLGLIFIFLFFYKDLGVGQVISEVENDQRKYELLRNHVFKQHSNLTKQQFLEKYGIENRLEHNYVIIDGIYFFFNDDRLSSIE